MEKKEMLFKALCKGLYGYEKDGVLIIDINSQPEIISHSPTKKDCSYLEDWKNVTINIIVKGRKADRDNGFIEENYRVENAKFDLSYDPNQGTFIADLKEILSISKY